MKKDLSKKYNHKEVELNKYQEWISKGLFQPREGAKNGNFTIVLPPPNVTGQLHLGHSWDGALQDIMIRYKRLRGFSTMWIPGMDHAGIATQSKVEKRMRDEEGLTRNDYGREEFLKKAWSWKEEYSSIIRSQWAKMGFALDYDQEKFTLDADVNKYVIDVFKKLYDKGLIYRGERVINWDPKQKTALSNIEVIHEEKQGKMYHFKYFLEDKSKFIVVATTRPETMFGDVCLFVHPDDSRYAEYVGSKVINPINGQIIPVMTDSYIDIEFGSGVMKCTPAHSFEDFELGKKHNLENIVCMNLDGTMNSLANEFAGMDRLECREAAVSKMNRLDLVYKIEEHNLSIGYSERSGEIVEPMLSKQWFVSMKPLAEKALKNQETSGKVSFLPDRFEKTFCRWMENIQDWCISRQLWWGHRIPVWYHKETDEVIVSEFAPDDSGNWQQDNDVLDTWFSSALWPIITTQKPELKDRFPNNLLVTGYDIIFFWVSRMIFQALELKGQKPFDEVLIHGLIRDSQGRKMSKSLGNGINPMDVIEEYGCDALRFFLVTNSSPGIDIRYSEEKIRNAWNFINKIWNITRFITMNYEEGLQDHGERNHHIWIKKRFNKALDETEKYMEKYDFVGTGKSLYDFAWNELCNTMGELMKQDLLRESKKGHSINLMIDLVKRTMIMLHPIIPFVTEEIYQQLPGTSGSIMEEEWPTHYNIAETKDLTSAVIDIISSIRTIRKERNLSKKDEIRVSLETNHFNKEDFAEIKYLLTNENIILVSISNVISRNEKIIEPFKQFTLLVDNKDVFNIDDEINKLEKQLKTAMSELQRSEKILSNPNFMAKASPEKVNIEKQKYITNQEMVNKITQSLLKLKK